MVPTIVLPGSEIGDYRSGDSSGSFRTDVRNLVLAMKRWGSGGGDNPTTFPTIVVNHTRKHTTVETFRKDGEGNTHRK